MYIHTYVWLFKIFLFVKPLILTHCIVVIVVINTAIVERNKKTKKCRDFVFF